jgi:mono/diheme cytochrome c family protein
LGATAWAQAPVPALKPGPGQQTVQAVCTRCHTVGIVIARPHTAEEWDDIIGKMVNKGMVATDEQLDEIAAYLAKNYGSPASHDAASSPTPATQRPPP